MKEFDLCRKREAKALRRGLVLRGIVARKVQSPVGPMPTLGAIRQMTLGDGLRVELPAAFQGPALPGHLARPGLLKRAWSGFKAMVRRRT